MLKQEIKIEFTLNDQKVNVGHQFLEEIIKHIPDVKENESVFDLLATSNNYLIRESISKNTYLPKTTINILLSDKSDTIVENILLNRDINYLITDEQLQTIISRDNERLLEAIGFNLSNCKGRNSYIIIKQLLKHPCSKVRYSFFFHFKGANLISTKDLITLCNDEDFDIACEARRELNDRKNQ